MDASLFKKSGYPYLGVSAGNCDDFSVGGFGFGGGGVKRSQPSTASKSSEVTLIFILLLVVFSDVQFNRILFVGEQPAF
ncbi:TPA: hypothetical protein KE522_002010 [Citrobacter koseri]|nr:hypothetical protein [Citrobacter koseri]